MRGHSKFEKREIGWHHETMQDICNIGTFDSVVFKLAKDPLLTMAWRTAGRPFEQLYTPAFTLAGPTMAQTCMTPEVGTRAQCHATPEQVSWSADRPIYKFLAQQFFLDWTTLARRDFMNIRNVAEQEKTQAAMAAQANAAKLEQKATFFGSPYPDGSIELNKEMAGPSKVVFKDVDAEGLKDAVITFTVKGAAAFLFAGVLSELYLFIKVDGKPTAVFDKVKFTK